jgi:hypothetical protein
MDRIKLATESLGVVLRRVKSVPLQQQCPFNRDLAIQFPNILVLSLRGRPDSETIGGMIHEMAHLLAGNVTADEDDRIGWEFAVAKKWDLLDQWITHMGGGYLLPCEVGDGLIQREFSELSADEQSDWLESRYDHAVELGYIVDDEPAPINST